MRKLRLSIPNFKSKFYAYNAFRCAVRPPLSKGEWEMIIELALRQCISGVIVSPYEHHDIFRDTFIESHLDEAGFIKKECFDVEYEAEWNGEHIKYEITKMND